MQEVYCKKTTRKYKSESTSKGVQYFFFLNSMSTLLKAVVIALVFGGGWAVIYLILKALF